MTPWPTTTPRRWQREALPLALDAIRAKTPAVVSAVMGAGKSVLLAEICASGRGRVVVTVPTVALVDQLTGTLSARLGPEVGRYYTHAKEADKRITVCCLPSLPQLVSDPAFTPPALWIADECFAAGTLVGDTPIEAVRIGDMVSAFDAASSRISRRAVTAIMARAPRQLLRLHAAGRTVVCTPEHPMWTTDGWMPALRCDGLCLMLHTEAIASEAAHDGKKLVNRRWKVHDLRRVVRRDVERGEATVAQGANVLRRPLHEHLQVPKDQPRSSGKAAPMGRGSHVWSQKPYARPRRKSEGGDNASRHWLASASARRERDGSDRAPTIACVSFGLADGGAYRNRHGVWHRSPNVIQGRHCAPSAQGGDRSGREQPPRAPVQATRREGGGCLAWHRVDRIEVLERGSDGRFGGLCPDGLVYNLEIEGLHTYTANGFVVHNCHKTEAPTVLSAHAALRPHASLGVTATPFLADEKAALSLWERVIYRYAAADAFADGVLVRPEIRHWQGGEVTVDEAAATMIRDCDGPGLANAVSIEDAEDFARNLTQAGTPARPIHSKLSRSEQAGRIEALRQGRIRCLVHVNMLSEGIDLPWLRWLAMRRPVGSRVRFCQEIGRVLRASPGKDRAVLLDFHDLFGAFGLTYEAALGEGMRATPLESKPMSEQEAQDCIDPEAPMIKAVEHWRRYLRLLVTDFLAAGAIEVKIAGGGWRKREASARQFEAARKAVAGLARDTSTPLAHRKALCRIADHAEMLNRGECSDLLTIGFCLRDRRRDRLPWPVVVEADA